MSLDSMVEFFYIRRQIKDYDKMLEFEREYLKATEKERRKIFHKYYKA